MGEPESVKPEEVERCVMQNSMIIDSSVLNKEIKTHHICPCRACRGDNEIITTFFSENHASSEGWKKTKHTKFCEPGKVYVWICPSCASAFNWAVA